MVSRLQDENRRILKQQGPNNDYPPSPQRVVKDEANDANSSATSDFQVLQRLRTQVEKHRNELKTKETDLHNKSSEVENVSELSLVHRYNLLKDFQQRIAHYSNGAT